jgi:plasmid stability protein
MPALHIRNVSEEVVAALKRRAAAHDRSLQQELLNVLRDVAQDAPPAEPRPPVELTPSTVRGSGSWRREEIYGDDER